MGQSPVSRYRKLMGEVLLSAGEPVNKGTLNMCQQLINNHWLNNHCAALLFGRDSNKPINSHMLLTLVSACSPLALNPERLCAQLDMLRNNIQGLHLLQLFLMDRNSDELNDLARQIEELPVSHPILH